MKKIFYLLLLFFVINLSCFADSDFLARYGDEIALRDSKIDFENKDYGLALSHAEQAKIIREKKIKNEISLLENSFKPAEVKYVGVSIDESIPILQERQDFEALEIIDWYRNKNSKKYQGDIKTGLIDFIKKLSSYPEADFMIGKIYCLEGEYELSKKFFQAALDNCENLDIPDQKYDILYEMANLCLINENFDDYEKELLLILSKDKVYQDKVFIDSMLKSIASNRKNCLEKFFLLYRNENAFAIKAYFDLSDFYRSQNESYKALEAVSIGVITAFTKINSVMLDRNPEYTYKKFSDFFDELTKYPDIIEWGIENKIWQGFYNLAYDAHSNKCITFTLQLLNEFKDLAPEEYWREKSQCYLEELLN
ncbi:MAG: hypothetical protein K6F15_08890 [Treponema sp.]|nr:hypothetical protein [Treponema sp.]